MRMAIAASLSGFAVRDQILVLYLVFMLFPKAFQSVRFNWEVWAIPGTLLHYLTASQSS